MDLNSVETQVLRAMVPSSEGNGHDFGFTDEIDFEAIGLTRHQYAGYVSSLLAKGAFDCFEDLKTHAHVDCNSVQFSFSEAAFKLLGIDYKG